jgi:hypothetical protein
MWKFILLAAIGIICVALIAGCSDQGVSVISGNGVITFINLEGGCWGVTMDGENHYGFSNLPESFRQEGLRVRLAAKISESQMSFCQADTLIDIINISKL